ncbi:MAG: tetratricopeptide repeat protein [Planctomycetaceae bacterium]|nr:tetratricopeptide repeat protein [Planctomycetaceae bacterium]
MALVDPYSPCPCGSDKKFKWCCQKVEAYAERAHRLEENGQHNAALAAYDAGLAKVPRNPWLLLRKSLLLIELQKLDEAKRCVATLLQYQPDHLGAAALLCQLVLATEGPAAAVAELQRVLLHARPEARKQLFRITAIVASELAKANYFPAALKHLELAIGLDSSAQSVLQSALVSLKSNAAVSPWLKESHALEDVPGGLEGPLREQFEQAMGWARDGLWDSAAAAFELLSADRAAGHAADHNLGLCRLWLGDDGAAVAALRRWIAREGPTTRAVDLEIVCQLIDESTDKEPIEEVQLTWPLQDRGVLSRILEREATIVEGEKRHVDPEDDESPEVACFHWLDRPRIEARTGLARQEIPLIQADVLVGPDTVVLEAHDDGRLNGLIDQFAALAGKAVPPDHPQTKVVGQVDRTERAMSWHWYLPPDLPDREKRRLAREQIAHLMTTVWPETPLKQLGGRSPVQAGCDGNSEVPLRAAVLILEFTGDRLGDEVDWTRLRTRLSISPEPAIDSETVDIDRIPLGRLALIPLPRLDDDRLVRIYLRAQEWGLVDLLLRAAHEIAGRPHLSTSSKLDERTLYADLAIESTAQRDRAGALEWVRRGRTAQDLARRAEDTAFWDMMEVQTRASFDPFDDWVPELAMLLERYREHEQASMTITTRLIQMGLVHLVSPPDRPGEVMLDTRVLQQLLSLYGPKVTTSSGYLGVSATRGEIWTPQSAAQGSAIWTPGSDREAAKSGEKRLILPG